MKSLDFAPGFEDDPRYCMEAPENGGRLNAVAVDAGHESAALFSRLFDGVAPDIGAYACARAGSLHSTRGLRPWVVSRMHSDCFDASGVPLFGEDCIFRSDNPSQVGSVRLGTEPGDDCSGPSTGGASDYGENIEEGSDAWCEIGDMVDTEPGFNTGQTYSALEALLGEEGECDLLWHDPLDGIDQFHEAFAPVYPDDDPVPGPDVTFTSRDCWTPRHIAIVIVEEFDGIGFDSVPILGFASFFLKQCEVTDDTGMVIAVYEKCDVPPGERPSAQIRGFFMNILVLEGDVGDFNDFGTLVIRLVQ